MLDVSIVNVAIKSIGADLGGGVSGLQWVVNAYTIAFAAFILTAGSIADRIGARRLFVGGFVLFMVASAVCGVAPDLGVLIGVERSRGWRRRCSCRHPWRCSAMPTPRRGTDARDRASTWPGRALALSGGPLVGGVLIATIGWRAIFFINVPVGAAGSS